MGLLDRGWGNWSDDEVKNDSINRGLLSTGLSLLNSRGSFGQALGAAGQVGLDEQQKAFVLGQNDKFKTTERLIREQELKQLVSIAAQRQKLQELAQKSVIPAAPAQQGNNPSAFTPGTPGGFDYNGYAQGLAEMGDVPGSLALQAQLAPEKPKVFPVDGALVEVGPKGVKELYKSSPKQNPNQPFNIGPNGEIVPNPLYQAYELTRAERGASKNINTLNAGQKGFDNTLKLRSDFRSEPIYKAHQDVMSAHSQISAALKQASPAGDLAGATKLMKILDPGSVVRESELGMAMAASGLLDRVTNYASMVINGQKLTPTQRKDFQTLADSLYKESERQYKAKRSEYNNIAKRNELNPEDVTGPEKTDSVASSTPPKVVDFGSLP